MSTCYSHVQQRRTNDIHVSWSMSSIAQGLF